MSDTLAMSAGFGRKATQALTHAGLTLAPRRGRSRWLVSVALVAASLAAGFGAGVVLQERALDRLFREPAPVVQRAPAPEAQQLRQQLEQARMGLRLSEARSQELERQIDTLNQKLAEAQDELTFFRKAREGKKH